MSTREGSLIEKTGGYVCWLDAFARPELESWSLVTLPMAKWFELASGLSSPSPVAVPLTTVLVLALEWRSRLRSCFLFFFDLDSFVGWHVGNILLFYQRSSEEFHFPFM